MSEQASKSECVPINILFKSIIENSLNIKYE